MRTALDVIAPRFREMAHRIGVAVTATTDADGHPHTRVMQPVWEWDGDDLVGWVSTPATSPKVEHLADRPSLSLTYWAASQDTCSADCDVEVVTDPTLRGQAWQRFASTPEPAGFDPGSFPGWDDSTSPDFGVLRLQPRWLRVMEGTLMTEGAGDLLTWRR